MDCTISERDVNQVRLVVESLLRVIQTAFDEEPEGLADRYARAAYQVLLAQIGTSYEELRRARGQPRAERRAFPTGSGFTWTTPDRMCWTGCC